MSERHSPSTRSERVAFYAGALAQAIVLGTLLALALLTISAWSGGVRSFRYEAF